GYSARTVLTLMAPDFTCGEIRGFFMGCAAPVSEDHNGGGWHAALSTTRTGIFSGGRNPR
ncbi:MAG: hypothetical protein WA433_13065, partial [Desulfobaccales bacterium]